MGEQVLRLGDLIDDYCQRCRRLLNHDVASLVDGQVVKVICRTCYTEHAFQHGQGGKKKPSPRTTLFDQVLSKASPAEAPPSPAETGPKKRPTEPARYISRHKGKPPRAKS